MARKYSAVKRPPDIGAAYCEMVREGGGSHSYVTLLGLKAFETPALLKKVEAGFPFKTFEKLRDNLGLQTEELAELAQIKPRTLARRRETGRLTSEESDRLLRACRLFADALLLFEGDLEAARAWLGTPAPALANRTPQAVACTDLGAREVEKLIGKLEHGVFI